MPIISPSERVSRYLREGEIRAVDGTMHYKALMPPLNTMKTSVFRTSGLGQAEIWDLAVRKVEPTRGSVIGRGHLEASEVHAKSLQLIPDDDPESLHADIVGWSEDRDHRATIAKELAAIALVEKRPSVQSPS